MEGVSQERLIYQKSLYSELDLDPRPRRSGPSAAAGLNSGGWRWSGAPRQSPLPLSSRVRGLECRWRRQRGRRRWGGGNGASALQRMGGPRGALQFEGRGGVKSGDGKLDLQSSLHNSVWYGPMPYGSSWSVRATRTFDFHSFWLLELALGSWNWLDSDVKWINDSVDSCFGKLRPNAPRKSLHASPLIDDIGYFRGLRDLRNLPII